MSLSFHRAFARALAAFVFVALTFGAVHGQAESTQRVYHARIPAKAATSLGATYAGAPRTFYAATPSKLEGGLLAYPPLAGTRDPITVVYLHGARGLAGTGCPWFRGGANEVGWLVCPEAIEEAAGNAWSWGGDPLKQAPVVRRALAAAHAEGAKASPGVAVGFSQGAYVALDLVKANLASFKGLVLFGAELHPNVARLKSAGVARIALGAGREDVAAVSLREETQRMVDEGMDARFFDLGKVGHTYQAEDTATLREAITWAAGGVPCAPPRGATGS